jgi:hypothetical protein
LRNVFDEAARRVLAMSAQRVGTHLVEYQDEKKKAEKAEGNVEGRARCRRRQEWTNLRNGETMTMVR